MRSWGVFLILWLALCGTGALHAAGAADAVLAEVSAALAQGQYQDAITLAASGLAEPSVSDLVRSRLLIDRGLARQALGANGEALADFTQGLSVATLSPPERGRALFARGVTLDAMGRLDDAVDDYGAVLKLIPGAAFALNNRANVRRRQNRLEEARRDYLAALRGANPNPQYPYYGLGQIAEAQGDGAAARGFYAKAVAADPDFQLALDRLQALDPPQEGPAGGPAAPGIIVLRPPPPHAAIILHPPGPAPVAAFAAAVRAPVRRRPAPSQPPGASLRPAIVGAAPQGTPAHLNAPAQSGAAQLGALAQLGAWRSEAEARNGWAVAQDGAEGLLEGLAPVIVTAEIPGRGIFYRLRVHAPGGVPQFCAALAQKGLACIPARD